jgi:hypothetical protein
MADTGSYMVLDARYSTKSKPEKKHEEKDHVKELTPEETTYHPTEKVDRLMR